MKKNLLGYMISLLLAAAVFAGVLPAEAYADALFEEIELPEITVEPADNAPADVGTREDEGADVTPVSSISDGLYLIESALSAELVLEIQNDSLANNGNAALGKKTGDFRQAFYVESCGEGVYTVRNYNSGLVIDVMGGMSANGTNIQQYKANGTDAQKWKITVNKDGTVTFTSVKNGKAMDVKGGKAAAGTNVQIYTVNGTKAQSWRLAKLCGVTEIAENLEDSRLADGYYRIISARNGGMSLGIAGGSRALCANAALYPSGGDASDIFKVTGLGGGLYKITAPHSGMVLDLHGGMIKNGTNIRQYTSNGTEAQQWYIRRDPATGLCAILSGKNIMTAADVQGGLTAPGTNVRAYRFNGTKAQFWQFKKMDTADVGDKVKTGGIFRILPASDPSLALTVAGAGTGNGANVELGRCGSGNEQLFSFSK
ncbi:MAG: RICIN domain-containing protein, partial [Lachnospiraceae bacterium]|nr:RICIN domain-containing protein [Lachnospiraceae bacterium]